MAKVQFTIKVDEAAVEEMKACAKRVGKALSGLCECAEQVTEKSTELCEALNALKRCEVEVKSL